MLGLLFLVWMLWLLAYGNREQREAAISGLFGLPFMCVVWWGWWMASPWRDAVALATAPWRDAIAALPVVQDHVFEVAVIAGLIVVTGSMRLIEEAGRQRLARASR